MLSYRQKSDNIYTCTSVLLQVSLTYFGADSDGLLSVLVSWATCDAVVDAPVAWGDCAGTSKKGTVTGPLSTNGITSVVLYGPSTGGKYPYSISTQSFWHQKWPKMVATGQPTSYVYDYSPKGGAKYASPILHHVLIKGNASWEARRSSSQFGT